MRHSGIGQLAVVDEPEHFQIREFAQRRDPLIAEFGRDDVERLNRFDVPEMLEESVVVRIDLAMIVRSRVGDGEVHELQRVKDRKLVPTVRPALLELLEKEKDVTRQLRALWALHALGGASEPLCLRLLDHSQESLRAWSVQLELEDSQVSAVMLAKLEAMAATEPSPLVRLYLASACQRLPHEQRWVILTRLAARAEDAADPNLPLMVWYALEPLVAANPQRALVLAAQSKFPRLREFVARRLASP